MNPPARDLVPVPPEGAPKEFLGRFEPEFGSRSESYPVGSSSLDTRGPTAQKRSTQLQLSFANCVLKDQLASRILKIDPENRQGLALAACHTKQTTKVCKSCDATSRFWNRCERRFCPICARRLARERQQQFEFWFQRIERPKFLTLTIKNTEVLGAGIHLVKTAWKSLRRSKLFSGVKSGLWSIEVTNQGNGWHVHLHAVIDVDYIEQEAIERAWSKRIGQARSIVDIRLLRGKDAAKEALKYSVKPSQMVNWTDSLLMEYLLETESLRLFGVWGELHSQRSVYTEFVADLRAESSKCECGCNTWRLIEPQHPDSFIPPPPRPPPPPPDPQLAMGFPVIRSFRNAQLL